MNMYTICKYVVVCTYNKRYQLPESLEISPVPGKLATLILAISDFCSYNKCYMKMLDFATFINNLYDLAKMANFFAGDYFPCIWYLSKSHMALLLVF